MKRRFVSLKPATVAIAALISVTGRAAVQQPPNQGTYTMMSRNAHEKLWQHVTLSTNEQGLVFGVTNFYTEIQTGMGHLVGSNQWLDSNPQLTITANGAQGTNSMHQVSLLGDINTSGAVDLTLPEGQHLVSNFLGLEYYDTASGKSVVFADVTNSVGELLPSGSEVLFPSALSGISADVLYVNKVCGLEQLIVLRQQPPSPSAFGLNPATTVLEAITEFLNPPQPLITGSTNDQQLDFGVMKMGKGDAFALGDETNRVGVTKQWVIQNGRFCLFEQVNFQEILPMLQHLPTGSGGSAMLKSPSPSLRMATTKPLLPQKRVARKSTPPLVLATIS